MQVSCFFFLTLSVHAQRGLRYLGLCVCLSVKSHLTCGASVCSENTVTYSTGNEGRKICGVFSENAPLLRSSGVAVVFHTFRWPFFFIAKVVHMRNIIWCSQLCLQKACRRCARRTYCEGLAGSRCAQGVDKEFSL